ncbi:hypothetical protein C9374_005165 [Naegleria lovaniensis]|uniref:Malic enzyme n=1 Tax=Naegleria lovaniensis TaxID=51637 RepID=A0AA88GLS7_NAELO|nr:uncharacterized protein C9374_005165 [Naegleria lovaniensis]KAG2382585.1 hypothetical protein C9374_005165 [Naegleria lovaniensis]
MKSSLTASSTQKILKSRSLGVVYQHSFTKRNYSGDIQSHNQFKKGVIYTNEHGIDVMNNSLLNKGTAFSMTERDRLGLRGLIPATISDIDLQLARLKERYATISSDIEKYQFCTQLQDRNETLFYRFVMDNIKEIAPIIYTPTVGKACENFSHIFRKSRGMFFSTLDKGEMRSMVFNWPVDKVDVIVVTDGGRILGLGDQGANGDGIPIGKLSLYVAAGGINPGRVLPVMLDVGTNNEKLLNDPLYLGRKHKRLTGKEYYDLVEEWVQAITLRWPHVLIQWEDFSSDKADIVLEKYRNRILCFNDDIQGTAAVILAGVLNCLRATGQQFSDITKHKFLIVGSGAAGMGVVSGLKDAMIREGLTEEQALKNFYIVDKDGLMTKDRLNSDLAKEMSVSAKKFASARDDMKEGTPLLEVVKKAQPDILLGMSSQPGLFCEEILSIFNEDCKKRGRTPIVFPLSNPTSKAECTAESVFKATNGNAIFASGSPFPPVTLPNGTVIQTSQANNMFAYPGVGLAAVLSGCKRITDNMFYAASKALAATVSEEALARKEVYPHVEDIRNVSKKVAIGVMRQAYIEGNAARIQHFSKEFIFSDEEMDKWVSENMWYPEYVPIVVKD